MPPDALRGPADWLEAQVVYRLYGLTEDEIKIVEGERHEAPHAQPA